MKIDDSVVILHILVHCKEDVTAEKAGALTAGGLPTDTLTSTPPTAVELT